NTVLVNSGQGEELILSLRISPALGTWPVFFTVLFWAAQSALWARLSLEAVNFSRNLKAGSQPPELLLIGAFPSIYALAIILTAGIPFLQAGDVSTAALAAITALFVGGVSIVWLNSTQAHAFQPAINSRLERLNRAAAMYVGPLLRLEPDLVSLFTLWPLA